MDRWERFLKTNRCCCGCTTLRKGAIIWVTIEAVIYILGLLGSPFAASQYGGAFIGSGSLYGFIRVAVAGLFLYGTMHTPNQPRFLLPEVICNVIFLCLAPLLILLVLIFGMKSKDTESGDRIEPAFCLLVGAVYHWHKAAVTYSLYKKMKEEEIKPNPGAQYQPNTMPQDESLRV